jgi:FAD/FMN-containing dehydrogenase
MGRKNLDSYDAVQTGITCTINLSHPARAELLDSNIAFQQMQGAATRIPTSDTAFPHRYDHFDLLVHPATDSPADTAKMIQWARECWEALQPFVEKAVYVNALEDALEDGERRVREVYGANYERLAILKKKYDPTNLFRLNSNIKPS